jgi:serine/threonine-protein kinase
MKQVSQVPQRPSSINPQVSPALDAVVMRALEKDPGRRFQNADAFIAALDAALKEPGAPAGGTAAFAALPPVVAAPEEGSDPEEEDRRRRRTFWLLVAGAVLIGVIVGFLLTRDTTTDVPQVTGNQLNVAIALLQQDGFAVGDITRVERNAPVNEVFEQNPLASPPADKAELDCSFLTLFCSKPKVDLSVSAGPGSAKVPSTASLTREEATEKLEEAGFGVQVEPVNSDTVEEGLVIHSNPSAGTIATRGSDVTLTISAGPKPVKVPVLVGSRRSLAVQQIRGRNLVASVSEEESSLPAGQVIRQSPNAGAEVDPGSTVSIVVSKGIAKTAVPNVIGKLRSEAVEALRAAGLAPAVQEQETEVPSQVGRVTDQFPPPGSKVDSGAEVTVVVGKRAAESTTPTEP